jgi:hypothetical protein
MIQLSDLYRASRSLESIENYACSDDPLLQETESPNDLSNGDASVYYVYYDDDFWKSKLVESSRNVRPENQSNRSFSFSAFALSEWIARVPGLFWTEGAERLRLLGDQAIQYESPKWTTLHPHGKSAKVMGGVGTLKLPQNDRGYRLVSLSAGHNASSGIPALISPEVWEAHDLAEGSVIDCAAKWQPMASDWASRFPSIRGIPKGYLMVEQPQQVRRVIAHRQPTQIHPFTVMEYARGNSKLFDFVYATADTGDCNYRVELEEFFEFYKRDSGRYGRYLLSADVNNPLWDADYDDPAALRSNSGAIAQLNLLEARVRNETFGSHSLDQILELLSANYDHDSLKRLSDVVGLPRAHWFATGVPTATLASRLLDIARSRERIEVLIDAIALDYPNLFLS